MVRFIVTSTSMVTLLIVTFSLYITVADAAHSARGVADELDVEGVFDSDLWFCSLLLAMPARLHSSGGNRGEKEIWARKTKMRHVGWFQIGFFRNECLWTESAVGQWWFRDFSTVHFTRIVTPKFERGELVLILQLREQVVGRSEGQGVMVLNKDHYEETTRAVSHHFTDICG